LGDSSKISQTQREKWEGLAHPIPSHIVGPVAGYPTELIKYKKYLRMNFNSIE
jgi:hypothetical protein